MSNLGSLYFALGLDDKQFNNAIEAAKKKVQELGANINVSVNVDTAKAVQQLQSVLHADNSVKINADISQLTANIKQAEKELQELREKSSWNTAAINNKQGFIENQQAQLIKLQQQLKLIESLSPTINLKVSVPASEYTRVTNEVKTALSNKAAIDVAIAPKINITNIKSILKAALENVEIKVNAKPVIIKKDLKKLELEANKTTLRNSISSALKNQTFKAKVELVVEKAKVQDAIRAAFQQAGMNYNTSASDVRTARIREIEARARSRELLDQERLNNIRNRGYREATSGSMRLNNSISLTNRIASQLGEKLIDIFSINSIQNFIRNLYVIGGEFQKQQIALQGMIGDAEKANVVFERIKDLSVKSPFSFSELTRYTKQMSAYGIKYEELYDTTKRLADISAGVGVDMSRLILAYGQVRSAEVLRGQELRQFTEAGIPLVAELAKRLEDVRGKSVEIGEVFDAISRREVSFGMVKDVLFDMTDPGGRFFESQERLAESLAGKWSNLKDAWDIMMAGIANSQNSALGLLVDTITKITREWRLWIPLMGGIVSSLTFLGLAIGFVKVQAFLLRIELLKNPYLLAASAIIGLATAVYGYVASAEDARETTERLNQELEKQIQILNENKENANRYLDILEKQEEKESEKLKLQKQQKVAFNSLVKLYPELLSQYTLEQMSAEKILEIRKKINEETNKQTLESHGDKIENLQKDYQKANEKYLVMQSRYTFAQKSGTWFDKLLMPSKEDVDKAASEAAQLYIALQEAINNRKAYYEEHKNDDIKIKLTKDSPVEDYIKVYRELGRTVKILRDADITGVISDPKLGKDIIKYVEELKEVLSEEEKVMDNFDSGSRIHQAAKRRAEAYKLAISSLDGVVDSQKNKDYVAELWKNRADEIDKAIKAYDKWKEVEGKDKASQRIKGMNEFADLFNGKYGFNLDLENPTATYEYIQSKLNKGLEKQRELYIQLGVKLNEGELDDAKNALKIFLDGTKKYIDETTSKWNLYKRLYDITGDKEISSNIAFKGSIQFENQLEQFQSEIERQRDALGKSIDFSELISMDETSLVENGFASLVELIKAYNEESKKLTSDSIENFIKIIEKSKDFSDKISDIERNLQKDLADLRANSVGISDEALQRKENQLIKNAEEEKAKIRFEEFKESSDWVKVFDDLDRVSNATLDMMIRKIEEFAKQAHCSEEVTKQLVDAMAKLRDESIERNPFKGFVDAWNRLKELNRGVLTENGMVRFGSGTENNPYTYKTKKQVDDEKAEANDDLKDSALTIADKFKAVADASDMLTGLFENMGISMDGFLGAISSVLGGAASGAQTGAGIASALGVAGPWGAIAGAAVGMLSSVFAMHDKALQKEIEASQAREEAIKNIAGDLERSLTDTMGTVYKLKLDNETKLQLEDLRNKLKFDWSTGFSPYYSNETRKKANEAFMEDSAFDAQLALMMAQQDELRKQRELEIEKKKTDDAKVADYERQIKELGYEIDNFAKEFANTLYGIDFKDWASQLSEAIVDAWANGEDAVLAYRDTVTNILKDLGVSVLTQKIIEPLLDKTMNDFIKQFETDNGEITDASMNILKGMYDGAEYAAEMTESYLEGLKKLGVDVSEETKGDSTMSKVTQSVTEDTANLHGSYLNSIRQDVSVKRSLIEKLVGEDMPKMSIIAQAQLTQLNNIASNTLRNADAADRIYDLFNRVVDKGGNKLKI